MWKVINITAAGLAYIVLGGFVVLFGMVSLVVREKLLMSEVVFGTAFGIILGPYAANIFNPRAWTTNDTNAITLEVMRVVLATGLFAVGVGLPQHYFRKHCKSLIYMVVPTMAIGWVISAALIHVLFPNLNFISALGISACLTPTDPILSVSIISGKYARKYVPKNIRYILTAESAANDGLAYPFLTLAIYLTVDVNRKEAIGKWFVLGCIYQVILGTILGAVLGTIFSRVIGYSLRKRLIDRESFVAQYLALALLTVGIIITIGADDLLGAFAAGIAINWDRQFIGKTEEGDEVALAPLSGNAINQEEHFSLETEEREKVALVFSSVLDFVLNCACFIYIGAWLPFDQFNSAELGLDIWSLVILFIGILLLRRIPPLLLLYKWIPDVKNWKEALLCGHFGPMGVSAIFISSLALSRLPEPHNPPRDQAELLAVSLQVIVSFVVLGSIIIHGLSIPIYWFGVKFQAHVLRITKDFSCFSMCKTRSQKLHRTPTESL